jgi:1-acyl-sn-glycerol-3-phosphate acyltransferase
MSRPAAESSAGADPTSSSAVTMADATPGYRVAAALVVSTARATARNDCTGRDQLRLSRGVLVAANHVSLYDFLSTGWFVHGAGRPARFLAKASLFRIPLIGFVFRHADQIPVHRAMSTAVDALASAERALMRGECVVVYPEGTLTKDPDLWPMRGKTGLVRLALATGAPVIPLAQWGGAAVWPRGRRLPQLLPRRKVRCLAGPPVDLSEYAGLPMTPAILRAATENVMAAITDLVGVLRDQRPPCGRWDPVVGGRVVDS